MIMATISVMRMRWILNYNPTKSEEKSSLFYNVVKIYLI